jgi:site-specific recombinase XerC
LEANAKARHLLEVRLTKVEQHFPESSILRATILCSSHYGDDTLAEYARHLARWWAWCSRHHHDPLEPNIAVLAIWVSEMCERYVWQTIRNQLGAIRLLFRVQRGCDIYDPITRRWSGPLNNIIMSARRDPKNTGAPDRDPLDVDRVKTLLRVRFNPVADVRDAALITLGFGGGLPAGVLRRMRLEWVDDRGNLLHVHHDARGYNSPFAVTAGQHDETCPIRNYRRWSSLRRKLTEEQEGHVFTHVTQHGDILTEPRLTSGGLNSILFIRSVAAGIDPVVRPSDMRSTAVRELGKLNLSDTRFLLEAGALSPSTAARYNRAKHAVESRKRAAYRRSSLGLPRNRP